MSKPRPRELNRVVPNHTANKKQSQDSTPGCLAPESGLFPNTPYCLSHQAPTPSCIRAPVHPTEHACIRSGGAHASSHTAPGPRESAVNAPLTPQSAPARPLRDPCHLTLCPAISELTKNCPPEKPSFKCSRSRPQTAPLLGNHKPTPFKGRYVTCLGKGSEDKWPGINFWEQW